MRIAIFELEHWEREVFDELSGDHEVRYEQRPLSRQNVESCRDVEIASPFIYSDLSTEPVVREEAELLRSVFREKHNLEQLLADHVLLRLRDVYVTPHNAFNTREAVERIIRTTVENIEAYAGGGCGNAVVGGSEVPPKR